MNKFLVIITSILFFGCANQAERKPPLEYILLPISDDLSMWLRQDHKVSYSDKDVLIYVRQRFLKRTVYDKLKDKDIDKNILMERNLSDYFFIANKSLNNGYDFLSEETRYYVALNSKIENINGVEFVAKTSVFDAVGKKKGKIFNMINEGVYSAPDCGLMKTYESKSLDLKIYAIDAVSCGQLALEVKHKKFLPEFKDRYGKFKKYIDSLFGFLNKN